MSIIKPQTPMIDGQSRQIYPLTHGSQVVLTDGTRLEKNGVVPYINYASTQSLTTAQKTTARSNIGAASADHSHSVSDLNADIRLAAYPVGSLYMSINSTSPAQLFGGTWEALDAGVFPISAGGQYAAGSTGGEASVTLTANQMPQHQHPIAVGAENSAGNPYDPWTLIISDGSYTSLATSTTRASTLTGFTGGGEAHNNIPPYKAYYMWERVA